MKIDRNQTALAPHTVSFQYLCADSDVGPDASARRIDTLTLDFLCDLLEAPEITSRDVAWFADGFQSWSPSWELHGRHTHPRTRVLRILDRHILRDGEARGRGLLVGHGICYLRRGEEYLCLLSRGRGTAPMSFVIDRARGEIALELHSQGAAHRKGEALAEFVAFKRTSYFAFADAVEELLRDRHVMARARFLGSRTAGWCSWYNYYTHIDESIIRRNLDGLGTSPNLIREHFSGKPVIFQIDDGWQKTVGDWEAEETRFPSGMAVMARSIASKGYVPGLWLAPFVLTRRARILSEKPEWLLRTNRGELVRAGWNPGWSGDFYCLDLSQKEVREYLASVFDTVINQWGFRFLKLDFLYAGMLNGAHKEGGAAYQWYRKALEPIVSIHQSRSGEAVAFLGCGAPLESSVDLFPMMRIGADTKETWDDPQTRLLRHMGRPAVLVNLKDTLGRAFWNRRAYISDPDVVFMRSNKCHLSESEKELVAAVAYMFASQIMISDDVGQPLPPADVATTRRTMELFRRLDGREYGAVELGPDLWRCFSRDGSIRGIVNLRGRDVRVAASGLVGTDQLTEGAFVRGNKAVIRPHSIALWANEEARSTLSA